MTDKSAFYVTTYCNRAHRLCDGKPLNHECYVIPPEALAAEMAEDYEKASALIQAGKTSRVFGEPQLPHHKGITSRRISSNERN